MKRRRRRESFFFSFSRNFQAWLGDWNVNFGQAEMSTMTMRGHFHQR